ncbi:MAG: DUF2791 family P-loop domain-containing protein [Candidatus Omnitrophica bacterium]|nr:DUF2791 family P-loop domain-containing protein [Candidatus Omnitrophota bacterium]
MDNLSKGKSPFYPGQPVPVDFFIGRINEIERIIRIIKQVELGKPQAVFLSGEYGIGKSSLASFLRYYAERNNHILGIHVFLGGAETLEDVAVKTVEAVIKQQIYEETKLEKIRNFFAKYMGQQSLFGLNINFDALKADALNLSQGYLPFLRELLNRFKEDNIKGIMLILDEINGITENKQFAHFIKGLVDENAVSKTPLPLLLMLCGVEERRKQMIDKHQPIERIFDIVEINPMNETEMKEFFTKTFNSVNMQVVDDAMVFLCKYSAGFPKLMHIVGDSTFWLNNDAFVNKNDATAGIIEAAEEIGRKFVDQQIYTALHSSDYRSILAKLAKEKFDLLFEKGDIEKGLSESERKKFHNFLQRMKKLGLLKSGEKYGEYIFTNRLARLYIRFKSLEDK